ncbi:sugar phosphate nucleotidyltransferase, partial [Paenibacillus sp. MCAF20]
LLSGGSGKRLWPLSSNTRAKQYLSVLEAPNGELESMVQRLWRQLGDAGLQEHTRFATSIEQMDLLKRQTGERTPLIIEPEQRGTFPAIALAASYLYSIAGVSLAETVIIMPVDAYVESDFFEWVQELPDRLRESGSQLMLIGMAPKSGDGQQPPLGSGIYAFSLDYMISKLIALSLPIHYDELYKQYSKLPKSSIESALLECETSRSVVYYNGVWKNLRSWRTISEEIAFPLKEQEKIERSHDQSQLINHLDIPIQIIGLSNLLVAASPDGILIADRLHSNQISEMLQAMNAKPNYEEKHWGHTIIVDKARLASGGQVVSKRVFIAAVENMSYHLHFNRSETWTILSGEGVAIIDEELRPVSAGNTVTIPGRTRHSLRAITDLELLEVQSGAELAEDDVINLGIKWDEIISQSNLV